MAPRDRKGNNTKETMEPKKEGGQRIARLNYVAASLEINRITACLLNRSLITF